MPRKTLITEVGVADFKAKRADITEIKEVRLEPETGTEAQGNVSSFGLYPLDLAANPSDTVLLDVYSFTNRYLESNFDISNFQRPDSNTVLLNATEDLQNLGYRNGKFNIQYKFLRNILGSGTGEKVEIVEISGDRLEARILPVESNNEGYVDFKDFFEAGIFNLDKKQILADLRLFANSQNSFSVYDFIQDRITYPQAPYSIILKLNDPLPDSITVGSTAFLSQELSVSDVFEVLVLPGESQSSGIQLKGPNFNADIKYISKTSSQLKSYNQLTGSAAVKSNLINNLFSGSFSEGVPLNIDYRKFDNFVHFGSAQERITGFHYKVQQIEAYNARLNELANITSSNSVQTNIRTTTNRRDALLGSFDSYERYLYYESSSYETSSFGEFYSTTWPKQNSTKPYTLFSHTSSEAESWFSGMMDSASLYDENNNNSLLRTVPAYLQEDDANSNYITLVNMVGHFYDHILPYVAQTTLLPDRQESVSEGFAKDLIYHVGQSLGIPFNSGVNFEDVWNYTLGTNVSGSYIYNSSGSLKDRQLEVWKRVINSLPYLLKTKGTERGLRALVNIFGIPSTMLRIREYGGPEATFDSVSDYIYDRFFYSLRIGETSSLTPGLYGSTSYGSSSYGSNTVAVSRVSVPWQSLDQSQQTQGKPDSVELRFRTVSGSNRTQHLIEKKNTATQNSDFLVKLDYTNTTSSIQLALSGAYGYATASVQAPVFDGEFWSLLLTRSGADDGTNVGPMTYNLMIKQKKYDKVTRTYSASLQNITTPSQSYNQAYDADGILYIGGATANTGSFFTGSVQELRYWTTQVSESTFNQHVLSPTSYVGNNDNNLLINSSSFDTLAGRFCFGSDNKKINLQLTGSIASQHPDQDTNTFLSASFITYVSGSEYYNHHVESHTLYWPDISGNRQISNKIRLQENSLLKSVLSSQAKLEIASNEVYPQDSPRLGLYFSPQDEVNQDFAEQFGGSSVDDLIGNPADLNKDRYPGLARIQFEYAKKYKALNKVGDYINRVKQLDSSVFELAKQLVPLRANFQTGLTIEPTVYQRNKFPTNQPTFTNNTYSASIDQSATTPTTLGQVSDVSGDSTAESDYLFESEISTPVLTPTGSYTFYQGEIGELEANVSAEANPYNNTQTFTALVNGTFPAGNIQARSADQATQYVYNQTVLSGSQWTSSLNPYWHRNPFQPTIVESRISEIFDVTSINGNPVVVDLFANSGSFNSSSFSTLSEIESRFGLTTTSMSYSQVSQSLVTQGLGNGQAATVLIPLPPPSLDAYFEISYKSFASGSGGPSIQAAARSSGSSVYVLQPTTFLSTDIETLSARTPIGLIADTIQITMRQNSAGTAYILLDDIQILMKKRARISDYQYLYEGKQRQLYKGTQQTSQDFNVDSDDTTDKGPVIEVSTVNPNELRQIDSTSLGVSNLEVD